MKKFIIYIIAIIFAVVVILAGLDYFSDGEFNYIGGDFEFVKKIFSYIGGDFDYKSKE